MRAFLAMSVMAAGTWCFGDGMMNARIRFEAGEGVRLSGKSACLETVVEQTEAGDLWIGAGEFTVVQPANAMAAATNAEGSVTGAAVVHMKELGWEFELKEGGEYEVWMRGWFPLAAGYNHVERMDGGEKRRVDDSVDGGKIDKFGPIPGGGEMEGKWLEPKTWHWYRNFTYRLEAGRHVLHFPPNGAWCAGAMLDAMALVRKGGGGAAAAEKAAGRGRKVIRAKRGVATSRRIKLERIAKWKFEPRASAGDGKIEFEYSYGGEKWERLEPGKTYDVDGREGYLYVRIVLEADGGKVPPVVWGCNFRVEKKGSMK